MPQVPCILWRHPTKEDPIESLLTERDKLIEFNGACPRYPQFARFPTILKCISGGVPADGGATIESIHLNYYDEINYLILALIIKWIDSGMEE